MSGHRMRAILARRAIASMLACATLPLTTAVAAHASPHHARGVPIVCQIGSVSAHLAPCATNGATLLTPPTPTYGLVPPIECDKHDDVISCHVPHASR